MRFIKPLSLCTLLFTLASCQGRIDVDYPGFNFNKLKFDSIITQGTFSAGSLIDLDLNVNGSDSINSTPLTYSCYVDNIIDQSVDEVTECSTIVGLSFNSATGELTWSPTTAQFGLYEFKVTGTAGDKSINSIFSFEVKNNPPQLDTIADQVVMEDSAITEVNAADHGNDADSDGQPLSYSCFYDTTINGAVAATNLCTALGAIFNGSTGVLNWTPNLTQAGNYEFSIVASDGELTDNEIFVITVNDFTHPPVLDPIADFAGAEGTAIVAINAADGGDDLDADGDAISYTCYYDTTVSGTVANTNFCTALGATFNTSTGVMNWTPSYTQAGTYEFKITGSDGTLSDDELFVITVANTNRAPVLDGIADQPAASENTAITAINAADVGDDLDADGDAITYTCYYDTTVSGTVANTNLCTDLGATFNTSTGVMDWTPSYTQAGTYEFKITGSDGSLSDDEFFVITVANTNRPPVLDAIADQSATSGYAITPINAGDGGDDLDVDGDTLTYTCYYDHSFDGSVTTTDDCSIIGVAFNSSTGSFTWTPSYIQRGDFEFKIIATDGSLTDETLFQIDVTTTQFVAMYNITADGGSMTIPLASGYNYSFTVNWGDGSTSTITAWDDTDKTHTYATAGDYIVAIEGTMEAIGYPSACNLKRVYNLGYMNWKSMTYAFATKKLISFVAGDTDTSQISNLEWTFNDTRNLVSANFTGFDTSAVTTMEGMFFGTGLTDLDLTSFDTRNVTNMREMFEGSSLVNLDVSSFRNNNATDMYAMFSYAPDLTNINLTGFTTPLVTDMSHMFANINATSLDLSSFNTSHVINFDSMFKWSDSLQSIDLSSFNTSNVLSMKEMFYGASALTSLDLSHFNTALTSEMGQMFMNTNSLNALYLYDWDIDPEPGHSDIFNGMNGKLYCNQGGSPGTGSMFGKPCGSHIASAPSLDEIANVSINEGDHTTIDTADGGDDFDINLEPISYSCYYDLIADGSVVDTLSCDLLGATFSIMTGEFDWTPSYTQAGTYEFKITGTDPGLLFDDEFFVITVANTNRAPVLDAIADQPTSSENTAITAINAADGGDDLDADGDAISYSCYYDTTVSGTVANTNLCTDLGATFNTSTGVMNWTPSYTQAGTYEFKITGTDPGLSSDDEFFVITVSNINRPPVLDEIVDQAGASENTAITTINAADGGDDLDIDTEAIIYTCYYDTTANGTVADTNLCTALGATFNTTTGVMDWSPNYSQAGTYEFKITGTDPGALSDDEFFVITVANTNRPPVLDAIADQLAVKVNSAMTTINAADAGDDFDADGQAITYTCYYDTTQDGTVASTDECFDIGVSFSNATGVMNWTPNLAQAGTYEFRIRGSDGSLSDNEIFVIYVSIPFTKLTASDSIVEQMFGEVVSISGTNVLIGVPSDEPEGLTEAGSAYLFRIDPATETYIETKITASDKTIGDFFGRSVSISGTNLLIGSPNCSPTDMAEGCAYLYQINPSTGAYVEKKIEASDAFNADNFGVSVSISGNTFIVGSRDRALSTGGQIYVYRIDPATGNYVEQTKIISSDWFNGTQFGTVLALSGDTIIAGDPDGSYLGATSGCAYVFRYNPATNSYHETKIGPSDGSAGDKFGSSVAISGNNFLVGAEYEDGIGVDSGSAYLYRLNSATNSYVETKIIASDTHEYAFFGKSVGISGNNFVVGANYSLVSGIATGAAYFYQINTINGNITETKIIDPEGQLDDEFGSSVAISGDNIIVGSYCDDGAQQDSGSAFLYEAAPVTAPQKFSASDKAANDSYGIAVSISGTSALIGAPQNDDAGSDSGSAYLYRFDQDTASYVETKITASDAAAGDYFGESVSIDGSSLLIGAPDEDNAGVGSSGSAYLYRLNPITSTYNELKIAASDGVISANFGKSVSISGSNILIGAYRDDDFGFASGSAYLYRLNPTTGSYIETKLTASDGAASDYFGISVSISGDNILIGSSQDDDAGSYSGSAYLFRPDPITGNYVQTKITASDAAASNYFGSSVSISGDQFLVGAYPANNFWGKAYWYKINPSTGQYSEKIITPSDPVSDGYFGYSVSISNGSLLIGSYGANGLVSYTGAAYLYRPEPGTGNLVETKISGSDSLAWDAFGYSVSISDNYMIVGSMYHKISGVYTGAAYLTPHNLP